jgi:hypothetical protein
MSVLLADYIILFRSGETTSIQTIARRLQQTGAIYGTGVHDLRKALKLEIIRERKPDVVAFGSSRPLDFRQEYFTSKFSCACQAMSGIDGGLEYARTMVSIHKPKLVIFALDFWWFIQKDDELAPPIDLKNQPRLDLNKLLKPLQLVEDHTISLKQYVDLLVRNSTFAHASEEPKIGLLAKIRGLGIRSDGSLLDGVRLTDYSFRYYARFAADMKNPREFIYGEGALRYGPNKIIYDARIRTYRQIIELFKSNGVTVIAVMPPIAPPIYENLDLLNGHSYFKELASKLAPLTDEFYDFTDPRSIGAGACEFTDIHHAGNTAYMRILSAILKQNPHSAISEYVEVSKLHHWIDEFSGLTIADFSGTLVAPERDFLRIGCDKNSRTR